MGKHTKKPTQLRKTKIQHAADTQADIKKDIRTMVAVERDIRDRKIILEARALDGVTGSLDRGGLVRETN